jgi:hypothetical protein
MRFAEPAKHLNRDFDGLLGRHNALVHPQAKSFALVTSHSDKRYAVRFRPDLIYGAYVGVIQLRDRFSLLYETIDSFVIFSEVGGKKLESYLSAKYQVPGAIYRAHAASAEYL